MSKFMIDPTSTEHLRKAGELMLRSFVPRVEQNFVLEANATFAEATARITQVDQVQRTDTRAWDIRVSFVVISGHLPRSSFVGDEVFEFTEVKTPDEYCPQHNRLNPNPAGPNAFNLGQIDHYGDPEVLQFPKVKKELLDYVFTLTRCP